MAPASPSPDPSDNGALFPARILPWSAPLVLLLASVVMFTALGGPRLWDRDEPRNAGCAAEMLAANDWVTPVFNGELRSHKPVLLYWLIMPGYQAFGVNEFTARMPSALLAVGTCLLTLFMGTRLFNRQVGLLSAIILCTTMMFVVAGRAATPDSVLIFFTTAATAVFVAWAFPRRDPSELSTAATAVGPAVADVSNTRRLPMRFAAPMYVLMGWIIVIALGPLKDNFSGEGLTWLVAGGIFYTVGAVLYSIKRIKFNHAIFHTLVLAGSFCHFVAVFWYVLPHN